MRYFIDMDGTLAVWGNVEVEELYEKGYFLNRPPHLNVCEAVRRLVDTGADVWILSAVLADNPYARREKNAWLNIVLPCIPVQKRIFPPMGENKELFVPGGVAWDDVLVDDYTFNLGSWVQSGRAIKVMNGVNGTKGTWQGTRVSVDDTPENILSVFLSMK